MSPLTRDGLREAVERPRLIETVPGLTIGSVNVRGMRAAELDRFHAALRLSGQDGEAEVDETSFARLLVLHSLCDDVGEKLLESGDIALVEQLPGRDYQRIAEVALRLNGYRGSAEGNGSGRKGRSSSGSRSPSDAPSKSS